MYPHIGVVMLISLFSLGRSKVTLDLKIFENWEENGLVCNDGSPYGYYIRTAPGEASDSAKSNWIFYLQGGGWCYSNSTCKSRFQANGWLTGELVSSRNWPETRSLTGIFSMSDPDWRDSNLVYVPYCSSDAHMGDSDHLIDGFDEIHFRGRRNVRGVVQELLGGKNNQQVLFGGTSAGGRGSMVLIDSLAELIGSGSRVWGVHDSGAYQDIPVFDNSYTSFGKQCQLAFELYQPPISEKCSEDFADELWKCICGEYMLPRVMTPSQVIIYLYDSYQLSNNLGASPADWTEKMCRYTEDLFVPKMRDTTEELAENPHHVVFGPSCYRHGILTTSQFHSILVDGVSAESQLLNFIQGFNEDVWSECGGVNCEETCPDVATGPNSFC